MPKKAECEICTHPKRYMIEQSLHQDSRTVFDEDIDEYYNLEKGTASHHMKAHVTQSVKTQMAQAVKSRKINTFNALQTLLSGLMARLQTDKDVSPNQLAMLISTAKGLITAIDQCLHIPRETATDAEKVLEDLIEKCQAQPELAELLEDVMKESDPDYNTEVEAYLQP